MNKFTNKIEVAFDNAIKTISRNAVKFLMNDPYFVNSKNSIYGYRKNGAHKNDWLLGFWCGVFWIAYEMTGRKEFRFFADMKTEEIIENIKSGDISNANVGFQVLPSCHAAYKITMNDDFEKAILFSADSLFRNYEKKSKMLVEEYVDSKNKKVYFIKVTDLINMLVLGKAYNITATRKYIELARKWQDVFLNLKSSPNEKIEFRYYYDSEEGLPLKKKAGKGIILDDLSILEAKALAWTVFGFAANYEMMSDARMLEKYMAVSKEFVAMLDSDYLCRLPGRNCVDVTSMEIAACGFIGMYRRLPENREAAEYYELAKKMMNAVIDKYAIQSGEMRDGLVRGCPYDYKVDDNEFMNSSYIMGDYFYLEALAGLIKERESCWY